jgi:hypothetical protein
MTKEKVIQEVVQKTGQSAKENARRRQNPGRLSRINTDMVQDMCVFF